MFTSRSREEDGLAPFNLFPANGTFPICCSRHYVISARLAQADMATGLNDDFADVAQANTAAIVGSCSLSSFPKLLLQLGLLLVGLFGQLEEEEGCDGGQHHVEQLEDPTQRTRRLSRCRLGDALITTRHTKPQQPNKRKCQGQNCRAAANP